MRQAFKLEGSARMSILSNNGNNGDSGLTPEAIPFRKRVREATREIESQIILEALEKNRWNRRRAAEDLRISYRLLMYKMKNCNLRDIGQASRSAAG